MSLDAWLASLTFPEAVGIGGWFQALALIALAVTCGFIVVIDARERIIPDLCNLLVAILGLVSAGRQAVLAAAVQGAIVFGLFWLFRAAYHRLRGHHGLGLGDVKFLGAAGTWIGLAGTPPAILVACLAALGWLVIARLRGQTITGATAIPFGPFLVVGFLVTLAARFA